MSYPPVIVIDGRLSMEERVQRLLGALSENTDDEIYHWNGSGWDQVPGSLKQISVGNADSVWGVNSDDEIYRWDGNGWAQVSGELKHVSVANDGTVWGVNSDDEIYRWNGAGPRAELGHGDFAKDIDCGAIARGHGRFDEDAHADVTAEFGDGELAGEPGQQDDFMATGVTWWARSRTTGQWRYLNTMKERLPELQLGKFDDDDIWDVAPRTRHPDLIPPEKYSKSGTSAWISRNVIHP